MKQHITAGEWGQFERSNPKQAKQLRDYYSQWQSNYLKNNYPNEFVTMDWWPIFIFLNIGQLIEFLDEHGWHIMHMEQLPAKENRWWLEVTNAHFGEVLDYKNVMGNTGPEPKDLELCDALWSIVKSILEKE